MIEQAVVVEFLRWAADKLLDIRLNDKVEAVNARNRLSVYFLDISDCLSEIAEILRTEQIPRKHGHCLKVLLDGFYSTLASNLTSSMEMDLTTNEWAIALERAVRDVDDADGTILTGDNLPSNLDRIVKSIERTAGQFRGLGIQIRAIGAVERVDT